MKLLRFSARLFPIILGMANQGCADFPQPSVVPPAFSSFSGPLTATYEGRALVIDYTNGTRRCVHFSAQNCAIYEKRDVPQKIHADDSILTCSAEAASDSTQFLVTISFREVPAAAGTLNQVEANPFAVLVFASDPEFGEVLAPDGIAAPGQENVVTKMTVKVEPTETGTICSDPVTYDAPPS